MPKKGSERSIYPKKWSEWALFRGIFRDDPLYHETFAHPEPFFGENTDQTPIFYGEEYKPKLSTKSLKE